MKRERDIQRQSERDRETERDRQTDRHLASYTETQTKLLFQILDDRM